MLITVKPKEKSEPKEIPYGDIKPGMVYKIDCGNVLLKLREDEAIVLTWPSGNSFLEVARGCKAFPAVKILGCIKEIIVEEV